METLDLNIFKKPDGLATVFSRVDSFENQEKIILKAVLMELYVKR